MSLQNAIAYLVTGIRPLTNGEDSWLCFTRWAPGDGLQVNEKRGTEVAQTEDTRLAQVVQGVRFKDGLKEEGPSKDRRRWFSRTQHLQKSRY